MDIDRKTPTWRSYGPKNCATSWKTCRRALTSKWSPNGKPPTEAHGVPSPGTPWQKGRRLGSDAKSRLNRPFESLRRRGSSGERRSPHAHLLHSGLQEPRLTRFRSALQNLQQSNTLLGSSWWSNETQSTPRVKIRPPQCPPLCHEWGHPQPRQVQRSPKLPDETGRQGWHLSLSDGCEDGPRGSHTSCSSCAHLIQGIGVRSSMCRSRRRQTFRAPGERAVNDLLESPRGKQGINNAMIGLHLPEASKGL